MNVAIIGGTGYAGKHIAREAAIRGWTVTVLSRTKATEPMNNVSYVQGSVLDDQDVSKVIAGSDVVVATLSPRGDMVGKLGSAYKQLARHVNQIGARLIVVGGFGTLRPTVDAPRFVDSNGFPKEYVAEAQELASIFEWLSSDEAPSSLDWLYVSPAGDFGSYNEGDAQETYRTSGEIALFDETGKSDISGADFALAVVNELEHPTRHQTIISFAY